MTVLATFIKFLNDLVEAPQDLLAEGLALYTAGEHEQALPRLQAFLETCPADYQANLAVGRIHLAARRYDAALEALTRAARYDHDNGRVPYQLAEALKATGDTAGAEAAYGEAVRLNPKFTDAFIQLGMLLLGQKRVDEAVKAFEQAIYLDRSAVVARFYLAKICIERKQLPRATAQLHFIKRVKPDYAPIYTLNAEIAEQLGDFRQVLAELQQVVKLGLADAELHFRMGVANTKLKDHAGAIGCFQRAIALGLVKWDAHCHLAQAHEALHQYDQALDVYRRLMRVPGYQLFGKRGMDRVVPVLNRIAAHMAA